jgi:DNA invertase Pin-like site-specific DNA recombinase
MSTEHQRYSTENQVAGILAYAAEHGYEIVRTYSDEGISGLALKGRAGLAQLLADVIGRTAEFDRILVFDVSRWGRFQDPDQSAHYEFLCREAGVDVEYCAEPFENDGSLGANILKQIKRNMAAEYSRELSAKVIAGQRRLAEKGFWQGGPPGYGLRRMILAADGTERGVAGHGAYKALQSDRTVLILGPPEELEVVRRIFRLFVVGGLHRRGLVRLLNAEGVPTGLDRPWSEHLVKRILTNESYIGNVVYGQVSTRLGRPTIRNPREDWVTATNVLPPVIRPQIFAEAQRLIQACARSQSDAEMLRRLASLAAERGHLSSAEIKAAPGLQCPQAYMRRFGGLPAAYRLIGHQPKRRTTYRRMDGFKDRLIELLVAETNRGDRKKRPRSEIWRQLVSEGFKGGYSSLEQHVRDWELRTFGAPQHRQRHRRFADQELLEGLRALLVREGRLSTDLIEADPGLPRAYIFWKRFGGLKKAYALIGYGEAR